MLMTGGLVGAAAVVVPPTYLYRTDVLLIPPAGAPGANPYLSLGGLREVTEVLSNSLSDDATAAAVEAQGAKAKFSVDRDATQAAPFVLIVVEDKDPAMALKTSRAVVDLVEPRLADLQRSLTVPKDALITSKVISTDEKATVVRRSQLRAMIAAAALGIFLVVAIVSAAERVSNQRSSRRKDRQDSPDEDDDPASQEQPPAAPPEKERVAQERGSPRRPRLASHRRAHERATR
jgi:hypothetical protein